MKTHVRTNRIRELVLAETVWALEDKLAKFGTELSRLGASLRKLQIQFEAALGPAQKQNQGKPKRGVRK